MAEGKDTDLILRCSGKDIHVHKVLVCAASESLNGICETVALTEEKLVIEFKEEDKQMVTAMVNFLYYGSYEPDILQCELHTSIEAATLTDICAIQRLPFHARVYRFADKYDIATLKKAAIDALLPLRDSRIKDKLARNSYAEPFRKVALMLYAASEVPADPGMREAFVRVVSAQPTLLANPVFKDTMDVIPDLATDISRASATGIEVMPRVEVLRRIWPRPFGTPLNLNADWPLPLRRIGYFVTLWDWMKRRRT